jgi:hypothetical protein
VCERALAVTTKLSHSGLGFECAAVMISTRSPFLSSLLSGISSWLIFTATQRLPMSVCTAYAKSTAVAPRGSAMIWPLCVKM